MLVLFVIIIPVTFSFLIFAVIYLLTITKTLLTVAVSKSKHNSFLQGQARRRKNMTEFLGDANIPSPDSLAQLGGTLPSIAPSGFDNRKNRSAGRFSGFFFPSYKVRELFTVSQDCTSGTSQVSANLPDLKTCSNTFLVSLEQNYICLID